MAEEALQKQRRRGAGRPFQPGQSGNPAGRRRGTKNRVTVLAERMLTDDIGEVVKAVVDKAKAGDMAAARLVVERALPPPRKGRPIEFPLSKIKGAADVAAALGEVAALMAKGKLSPDEASAVAGVLETHRKAIETSELEQRVAALEKRTEQKP
jgi:hypothetical protein